MADYAIGDIQGCYDPFMKLLEKIQFDEKKDKLWLVGDLVNRGPQSLDVLRFVYRLPAVSLVLGNHDLYLLHLLFNRTQNPKQHDTLDDILHAPDAEILGHWLRQQPLLHHDIHLNIVMTHAGIYPFWNLHEAKVYADFFSKQLQSAQYAEVLMHLFGIQPNEWSPTLAGFDKLRFICNAFTRMRFCDENGRLMLSYKGTISNAPPTLIPWFHVPYRKMLDETILFGHWAALQGQCDVLNIEALDTGCVWGNTLTALRIHDRKRFCVEGV